MLLSKIRICARNSIYRHIHSIQSKPFEKNKRMALDLSEKAKAVYLSGVIVTAPILFFGNMYYGVKMSSYEKKNRHMIETVIESSVKVSYSINSWGFVVYAIIRHINRYNEAEISSDPNILYGHYKMHFIPNAMGNLSKINFTDNMGLKKFFVEVGILMDNKKN